MIAILPLLVIGCAQIPFDSGCASTAYDERTPGVDSIPCSFDGEHWRGVVDVDATFANSPAGWTLTDGMWIEADLSTAGGTPWSEPTIIDGPALCGAGWHAELVEPVDSCTAYLHEPGTKPVVE